MEFNIRLKSALVGVAVAAGILAISQTGFAHGPDGDHPPLEGIQKERSEAMKAMGGAAKSTGQMLKGEVTYDADKMKANAKVISDIAGAPLLALFPKGSNMAPSEALDKIWEDQEGFAEISNMLKTRADAFGAV